MRYQVDVLAEVKHGLGTAVNTGTHISWTTLGILRLYLMWMTIH